MRLFPIFQVAALILIAPFDSMASDLPQTDQAFAARAIQIASPGRSWSEVEAELKKNGFWCSRTEERRFEHSERVFREYKCGAQWPAYHGCVRSAAIGTFDDVVKHLNISLIHPSGELSEGSTCGR